jgi:hypothetical protein
MRVLVVAALIATGCSFAPGAISNDASPDATPSVTVGFATSTTLADTESGVVAIRVVLSAPSTDTVSVNYAFTGGSATRGADYTADDGTLTFAPGVVDQAIEVTISVDADQDDETVEIELQSASGAALTNRQHTLTISAHVLPRVNFSAATSTADEAISQLVEVTLTKPSPLQISVTLTASGTATGGGVDYTLSATTVTFLPGDVSEQVMLTINDDVIDEHDETVALALDSPVNVIVGTTTTRTHTIEDNDLPPTVSFAAAASSTTEDAGAVDLVVSLSAESGKQISVPFSVDSASSAASTDYAIPTASPLVFAPGELQKMIRVNITQDTAVEAPETVIITFGTLVNVEPGAHTTHTLTIIDDDQSCLGTGDYMACYPTPTAAVTVTGTLNTDTSMLCQSAQPGTGWTSQPASCFVVGTNISVTGVVVTGSRPLVLFASGNITVSGGIDAASHRDGTTGPGAASQLCSAFPRGPKNDTSGAGGGAGGTFRTKGGNGGNGNGVADSGGLSPNALPAPTELRAGCTGQKGGRGNSPGGNNGGEGGPGGGALYLVAGGTITINNNIVLNVSGAGATALTSPDGGFFAGGGGGGSGGMIKLHAATLSVSGARLMANGGGGSGGADHNTAGTSGNDPTVVTAGGTGGTAMNAGGNGGNGFGGTNQAQNGANGGSNQGGGGGGGGGGHIESNLPLSGATLSPP